MQQVIATQPGIPMRILHFAPTRMALLYVTLVYLYLSGFYFRGSYTHGPLQALVATLMAGAMMLIAYASLVVYIERRAVSELALPPMPRELGLGLLIGFALFSACMLILMALGNYRIDGLQDRHILLTGLATALATGFLKSTLQGSEWLTGGSFGVEASVVPLVVCGTVGVLMLVKAVRLGRIVPPPWKRKG